jgi:hypothetical protein
VYRGRKPNPDRNLGARADQQRAQQLCLVGVAKLANDVVALQKLFTLIAFGSKAAGPDT